MTRFTVLPRMGIAALAVWMLAITSPASAQLTGIKTIPGNYATLAQAIADLNAQGVGAGGVTFNVSGGYTETISAPLSLTATGTALNPIVFQYSGSGSKPKITAYTGGGTPSTAVHDDIWRLVGSDYVTIDGIDLAENPANVANPATMEGGYVLYKASATNGCQHVTIQNCTITLNRVNSAAGTFPSVDGSRCIEQTNATPAAATTPLIVTASSGASSFNHFYSNIVQNCHIGIALTGYDVATPSPLVDQFNEIGGAVNGNTVRNYGGGAGATTAAAGVRTFAQDALRIVGNGVDNNTGTGVNHGAALFGIFNDGASLGSDVTIDNNTVTVKSAATTATLQPIFNGGGVSGTGTIAITNNSVVNCTYAAATSGSFLGIANSGDAATIDIYSNSLISNSTGATTGANILIQNTGDATANINIYNNTISGWTFSRSNSGVLNCILNSTPAPVQASLRMSGNTIDNISHAVPGGTAHNYIRNASQTQAQVIDNNTFTNLDVNTVGGVNFVINEASLSATGSMSVSNNSVNGFHKGGDGGSVTFYNSNGISVNGSTVTITGNNISDVTLTGFTSFLGIGNTDGASSSNGPTKTITFNTIRNISADAGTIVPLTVDNSGANSSISSNTISNIICGQAITAMEFGVSNQGPLTVSQNIVSGIASTFGNVVGMTTEAPEITVSGNTFHSLSGGASATVYGIACLVGTTVDILKNRIHDLTGNNANSVVNGIYVVGGTTVTIANNLIGNLYAPIANSGNAVRGIHVNSSIPSSTINLYDNSIYLAGSSSGATFGSSGIFHMASATATTGALNMRNNIVANLSVSNGAGLTVAYRRSGTALNNYASTSNNNLLYAGTPGASRLIFTDGTNMDQTLAAYRTRVAPRDSDSVTESPPFVSTDATNAGFLHVITSIGTQIESGGAPIAGVTDDYDGDIRNVSTPDIGADEGNFGIGPLCGIYYVGSGHVAPFTTLTGAVGRLNSVGVSCPVTFLLTDNIYATPTETFPITIEPVTGGSAVNTVTIKPDESVFPGIVGITGSSSSAMIVFNGCDYVTLDGSAISNGSRDLSVVNGSTSTSSAVIWGQTTAAANPVTHVTVENVQVSGNSATTTLVGIGFGGSTIGITSNGNGNSANRVENCSVDRSQYGIYSAGASALAKNSGTIVRDNRISTTSVSTGGIYLRFEDGPLVTGNVVGEINRSNGSNFGISLGLPAATNFLGSTIYDEVTNGTIASNKIQGVVSPSATGFTAVGIAVGPAASGTTTVVNNMISGVTSPATPLDATLGIYARAAMSGGLINVWFNSVSMAGDRGSAATNPSFALGIAGTNPLIDVRDNILHNVQTSVGTGKSYAIGTQDTVLTNMLCNYNDLYAAGTSSRFSRTGGLGNAGGTDRTSLPAWRAATSKDLNSISADPLFVSTSDLHIWNLASPVGSAGQIIGAVTTDIDGETGNRSSIPDIGADEFGPVIPSITIDDAMVVEGNYPSTTPALFHVFLSAEATDTVKVRYATANGTAAADTDYVKVTPPALLVFAPGETQKDVTITVIGDAYVEGSEIFFVNLTSPQNGVITDGQGVGTILNDDAASAVPDGAVPARTYLMSNYPNPFRDRTTIAFGLHEPGAIRLQVFDVAGRLVRNLKEGTAEAADQRVVWDGLDDRGRRVGSGFYLLRMAAEGKVFTKKMRVVR